MELIQMKLGKIESKWNSIGMMIEPVSETEIIISASLKGHIITIRADFQQGMDSVSQFKMNMVTENYWLIYAQATIISRHLCGVFSFSHWVNLKLALRFHALLIMTIIQQFGIIG